MLSNICLFLLFLDPKFKTKCPFIATSCFQIPGFMKTTATSTRNLKTRHSQSTWPHPTNQRRGRCKISPSCPISPLPYFAAIFLKIPKCIFFLVICIFMLHKKWSIFLPRCKWNVSPEKSTIFFDFPFLFCQP